MAVKETVFLSSVAKGLEPYREAVYKAIEGLQGYHCIRMEDFGARDAMPRDVCLARMASSTLFVGILGHQYGSIDDRSNMSFTELEYETAMVLRKRMLMFIAPDDFPVQAHVLEPDALRLRQQAFRGRVLANHQVAFFNSADELGRQVLQAIHNCQETFTGPLRRGHPSHNGRTTLLFPFVTNQGGLDTGICVSNVSLSPLGTEPQVGTATIYFYGNNAPAPITTTAMFPGHVFTALARTIAPNFQGYIIIECNFAPARGYAFISDVGARNLSTGYLAEVLRVTGTRESTNQ